MENSNYLYPFFRERCKSNLAQNHLSSKKLSYKIIEKGVISPDECGGVFDNNNQFIEDTNLHAYYCEGKLEDDGNVFSYDDSTVIYCGYIFNTWGHLITDCIARVWFIKYAEEYFSQFKDCKLVYINRDNRITQNFKELIAIIGLDFSSWNKIEKTTKYNRIIIPDKCFFNDIDGTRFYTKEYIQLIDEVRLYGKNSLDKQTQLYKRVYFSHAKYKLQIGERLLEEFFKSQGYEIIYPERLSFIEQLKILLSCDSLASTIGSCSHNSMFMDDKSQVILIPRANYLTGYQLALNSLWNQNIIYVDSSLSILTKKEHPWSGPFYYYVSENLMNLFGVTIHDRKKYLKKNMKNFRTYINQDINYYNNGYCYNNNYSSEIGYFELALNLYKEYKHYGLIETSSRNVKKILRKIKAIIKKIIMR